MMIKSEDFIDVNTKTVLKTLIVKLRKIGKQDPCDIESDAIIDLADMFNSAIAIELFCSILLRKYRA